MNVFKSNVFPAPVPGYDQTHPCLIFINDPFDQEKEENMIAAMYYKVNDDPTVLLYSHGNGTDIGYLDKYLSKLAYCIGINIISYDYPGYGLSGSESPGLINFTENLTTSSILDIEKQCYRTINCVINYLLENGSQYSDIILYGSSIGTGPTVDLAARIQGLKGIILQTPFTQICVTDPDYQHEPIAVIFENYKKIKLINSSVTILHGTLDQLVPYPHALLELMNENQKKCKLVTIDDASHNDIELDHFDIIVTQILEYVSHGD